MYIIEVKCMNTGNVYFYKGPKVIEFNCPYTLTNHIDRAVKYNSRKSARIAVKKELYLFNNGDFKFDILKV